MNIPPETSRKIEAYLRAVENHLAHKSPAVRKELLDELRDHIAESLRRQNGDIDRVLGEMDPPESFSEQAPAPTPAVQNIHESRPVQSGKPKWFALACAFLLLNAYAVWKLTNHATPITADASNRATVSVAKFSPGENAQVKDQTPLVWTFTRSVATSGTLPRIEPKLPGQFVWSSPTELRFEPATPWRPCNIYRLTLDEKLAGPAGEKFEGQREFHVQTEPLKLVSVEQANISHEREVTLRLTFNESPDREFLKKFLSLSEEDDPEVDYELVGRAGSNVVLIKTEAISHDKFNIAIAPGLPAKDGSLGMSDAVKNSIAVISEFQFQRANPESAAFESCLLKLLFSSRPDPNGLASKITVSPPVKFTAEPLETYEGAGVKLTGGFKPGSVYTLTIKAGLKSEGGTPLPKDIVRHVQFPNRPPSISIATSGRYLSPRGKLLVPISAMNVRDCEVSLAAVYANNLVQFAMRDASRYDTYYGSPQHKLTGRFVTQTNAIDSKPNEAAKLYADLRSLAGGEPRGVYWLGVRAEKTSGEQQLVVVTDLGIAARIAKNGVLVWVNSLRDAKPAVGADITLFSENNQVLGRGKADASGLAFIACKTDDDVAPPFLVTAQLGDDLSYLDLARNKVAMRGDLGGENYLGDGDVEAFVFTERGVYRPGETSHMKALVRNDKLQAPKPFPAIFRIRKPDGRVFKDIPVTLDPYGAAEASAELPDYLPTGRYTFELAMPGTFKVIGETIVSVEDFVPPQIRVDITAPTARGKAGDAVSFDVKSAHLFGRAASGLKGNGFVSCKAAPFAPAAWKDWKFGDDEKPFSTIYRQLGAQVLDEEGKAQFSAETSDAWRPPAAVQAVFQATVIESSGRPVTAYASSFLDVYPYYIGVRGPAAGTIRVGETQRVSVVEVAPDGKATTEAKPLQVKIARVQWNSFLSRNNFGRYEWKSERDLTVVREDTLSAGGTPSDFAFAVDASGEYLVTFSDPASGTSSSIKFHAAAADQSWVEWSREKPDFVELTLDRKTYRPGDEAKLLIKAPFSGLALLTIESDRVLTQRLVKLEKNTAEVQVPVLADYVPNVYCSLTHIRPAVAESVWSAHRASGSIALAVEPPSRRLTVAIDAPATNRPQAKMTMKISVRDENGKPVAGDATVMAVDEGICMLTAFQTPDPMKTFFAQRRLGIDLFDLYAELMPVIDDAIAGSSHIGGDDGSSLRKRLNPIKANRFKPVALWSSNVHLDAKGEAEVPFDVPEFSGELRLMAVAYNAAQAGSSDSHVLVKRGLVVQPSLPRFLAPGDVCDATIDIYNESGKDLPIQIRLTCGGPLAADKPEQTITLKAGASKNVRVPLKAGAAPGKAICTVEVNGGVENYRETIELAVRPAAGLQVAAQFGTLKAGEKKEVTAPDGWVPESIAQDIWVSHEPSLKLGRALDYVMHYPYGCLEQTTSGSFPLLYAADLANRLLPNKAEHDDVANFVQAGILRVLSMQQADGSFSMWPYQRGTWNAGTIYAAHFLAEAKKASYNVPQDRLDAALNWLRERLDKAVISDADPKNVAWQDDMQERAYACHVLALAGKRDHGWNARLREEAVRLRFAARVHVASALLLSGEPRQATEMMTQLGMPADRPREIGGLLNSSVRDASLLLSAWLDIDPKNEAVARLVQFIDKKQGVGHWYTTQDDAMALLALGKYAQRVPADTRPFSGILSFQRGLSRAFSSTQDVHHAAAPGQAAPLTIANDGPGTLYFSTRFEGVPAGDQIAEGDHGIAVHREFYDMNGANIDAATLEQGALVVVKIVVDTKGRDLDNIAIEELIPAGWEIENPNLATSQQLPWMKEKSDWCLHRDIRDDRLVLFTGAIGGTQAFYYAARAVTPGKFIYPPVTAACMYDPEIRSVAGRTKVTVKP